MFGQTLLCQVAVIQPLNHFEQQAHLHAAQTSQSIAIKERLSCDCKKGMQAKKTPKSVHI
jgi:hypothetical protein